MMSKVVVSVIFMSLVMSLASCSDQKPDQPTPTITPTVAPTATPTIPPTPTPEEVTVTGCLQKGVEAQCSVLTAADGTNYSFVGGDGAENTCYEVTGTKTTGFCMQGTQLNVTKIEKSEPDCCQLK